MIKNAYITEPVTSSLHIFSIASARASKVYKLIKHFDFPGQKVIDFLTELDAWKLLQRRL